MDWQVYVIKTVAYSLRTDRHTQGQTDRNVKTEGPKIFSNDIFYFKTAIIGGPKYQILKWSIILVDKPFSDRLFGYPEYGLIFLIIFINREEWCLHKKMGRYICLSHYLASIHRQKTFLLIVSLSTVWGGILLEINGSHLVVK